MKKLMAVLLVAVMLLATTVSAFAYNVDPTMGYGYNNGYGYNSGYGYNCTGMRLTYSDAEFNPTPWFNTYVEEYGIVFHLYPTMPISRSDVFATIGKAMNKAYDDAGRTFSTAYGVNFVDYTWDSSLYTIAGGLYQRGIMLGYPEDNTVKFYQNITRAEFAKVIVLTSKQNGNYMMSYNTLNTQFTDIEGHWAAEYIKECAAMGLMYGKSVYNFAPEDLVTYEEYLAVMLRIAEKSTNNAYSFDVDDFAYGVTTTMDIDFEGYEFDNGEFELETCGSTTIYMNVGDTKELKVKGSVDLEDYNKNVEWETSKNNYVKLSGEKLNGKYATVNVKALKEGKITIKAIYDRDNSVYAKYTVVISNEDYDDDNTTYVSSIKLNPSSVQLSVGESKAITATVYPSNATNKGVIWESHNEAVATVSTAGKITAVGVGNTTVTATAKDGNGAVATIEVTVTAEEVLPSDTVKPQVELTGADSIDIGKISTLTVKVNEDNLKNFTITEKDILGLTGGASINKISKVSNDTYEIKLMGVEVSSMALCIGAGVAEDTAGNVSEASNEVIVFINSGE